MTTPRTPSVAPRWTSLSVLAAGVLGVHLVLLLGPVAWAPSAAASPAVPSAAAELAASHHRDSTSAETAPSRHLMTRASTVRWIVPAAQPPVAPPTSPLLRSTPPARPAAPRAEAPAAAPPPEAVEAPTGETAVLETVPGDTTAPAEPRGSTASAAPSEPLPEVDGLDGPGLAPEIELFAAADMKKRGPPVGSGATRALPPAQPPASTRLDYAVSGRAKGIAYNAEGQLDWTLADGRYSARMEIRVLLLGSRVQTSTGSVGPTGLVPERFSDKSRSEKAAHFDGELNRIRFSNNAPEAVRQPGAQDRLSLFMQIAGLMQARPKAYASGQTIEMQVAGTGDADIWRFEVGDEVTLSLPAGEVRARQIKRLPRKEFDSTVEMWLAPELQHLPVRLRVTQANGDVADQQIRRLP